MNVIWEPPSELAPRANPNRDACNDRAQNWAPRLGDAEAVIRFGGHLLIWVGGVTDAEVTRPMRRNSDNDWLSWRALSGRTPEDLSCEFEPTRQSIPS